jgi:hypothetical protein
LEDFPQHDERVQDHRRNREVERALRELPARPDRSGELAHSKCGRAIRVSVADFEAFMAARRVGGDPTEHIPSRNAPANGSRALR